jgi:alpha-methylacyl-CoA racemase
MRRMALDPADWPQWDKDRWPELQDELAAIFLAQPQQHWVDLLEGSEACVAAVVPAPEAPAHPHNVARESFIVRNGLAQPAPAPRFSRTPATAGETTTAGANDPDLAAGALWP